MVLAALERGGRELFRTSKFFKICSVTAENDSFKVESVRRARTKPGARVRYSLQGWILVQTWTLLKPSMWLLCDFRVTSKKIKMEVTLIMCMRPTRPAEFYCRMEFLKSACYRAYQMWLPWHFYYQNDAFPACYKVGHSIVHGSHNFS